MQKAMERSRAMPHVQLRLIWLVVLLCPSAHPSRAQQPANDSPSADIVVIGATPLVGSGLDRNKVPGETDILTSEDIGRTGAPDALRALTEQVGGINLDSASGNPDQPTLFYHGFEASPLQGVEQGLAVYLNGVRFNQAFGDTVNWEVIPSVAIRQIDVEGSNPVFGLNALGGSLNVELKNGFSFAGGDATIYGGSYGRIDGEGEYGARLGEFAIYVAGRAEHQDGWRDLQATDVQNFYGDIGWRRGPAEAHVSLTLANSVLNGPGTSPVQLIAADFASQFTAPNLIANRYAQVNVSGSYEVSDTLSVQSVAYYNYLLQRVANGNSANDTPCDDGSGLLCSAPGVPSTTRNSVVIPDFLHGGPYSELDDQTTNTNGYGVSAQATSTAHLFGLANHLVGGASFDGAQTEFGATAFLGGLTPLTRVFIGPGVVIDEPGNNEPARVAVSDAYVGVFATDSLSITPELTLTAAARFNNAEIDLSDQGGGSLTGQHSYSRFNPAIGATYEFAPWLTAYAGYSEANRAPTPAELSCAGPADSCSLANFFVGDPNLKQVVAHTEEAGLRGTLRPTDSSKISYDVSLFHTYLDDDIVFVNSVTTGRAFFENVGRTRRQGVDVSLIYKTDKIYAYADYSYVEATYQTGFVESAGSNPAADANGNLTIAPGDRLPGIPANQAKFGASWKVTDEWTVGGTIIVEGPQYLFGDESNLDPKLPGYTTLNLYTQYQLTPHIQLFGLADNVTDARYYTYGTFSPTSSVFLAQAPNATNPRAYSPASPVAFFGGVKVTF
jgi:outer membrane receptor protein involved in Fe transport